LGATSQNQTGVDGNSTAIVKAEEAHSGIAVNCGSAKQISVDGSAFPSGVRPLE